MGIGPNGTNTVKMGGVTTPAVVSQNLKAPASTGLTIPANLVAPKGENAQTRAYGKAMNSAFKNTKTFGIPGAK